MSTYRNTKDSRYVAFLLLLFFSGLSAEFVHGVSISNNFISGAPTDFNLFGFMEAWHANVVPKPAANEREKTKAEPIL